MIQCALLGVKGLLGLLTALFLPLFCISGRKEVFDILFA